MASQGREISSLFAPAKLLTDKISGMHFQGAPGADAKSVGWRRSQEEGVEGRVTRGLIADRCTCLPGAAGAVQAAGHSGC